MMWRGETATVPVDDRRSAGAPELPAHFFADFDLDPDDVYVERYDGSGWPGGIREGDLVVFSRSAKPTGGMIAAVELVAPATGHTQKFIGVVRNGRDGRVEVEQTPGFIIFSPPMEITRIHLAVMALRPQRIAPIESPSQLVLRTLRRGKRGAKRVRRRPTEESKDRNA